MEYKIAWAYSVEELEKEVQALGEDGWEVAGGVSVKSGDVFVAYQAMTRPWSYGAGKALSAMIDDSRKDKSGENK